jgi:hypothetical protein
MVEHDRFRLSTAMNSKFPLLNYLLEKILSSISYFSPTISFISHLL